MQMGKDMRELQWHFLVGKKWLLIFRLVTGGIGATFHSLRQVTFAQATAHQPLELRYGCTSQLLVDGEAKKKQLIRR